MASEHESQKINSVVSVILFIIAVIVGVWAATSAAQFIVRLPGFGSVAATSAITLWSVNSPTDPVTNRNAGISVQSSNYPPQPAVKKSDVLALEEIRELSDLSVTIEAVGILAQDGKTVLARTTLQSTEQGAVRFSVANEGDVESPSWEFLAHLPTDPVYVHTSDAQKPLNPNKQRSYILIFDQLSLGEQKVEIEIRAIDPKKSAPDKSFTNNVAKVRVTIE